MRDNPTTHSGKAVSFPAAELWRDWRMLAETIAERRAGTPEEERAANYIAAAFRAAGVNEVVIEPLACTSLRAATVEVHESAGRGWNRVDAVNLVGAPGTRNGKSITGELTWLELPENGVRLHPGALRGRIAAIFGPLPTSVQMHRRLLAAQPLAVIHVDDRLPFPWTKNDGTYPHWNRRYGMPTMLTVPYSDAWRWRRDGVSRLKLRVAIDQRSAQSQNVIADLPGTDPRWPALVLTAHHDTQCNNPGADDNASGVVCLLALARALARRRLRRTVRLISFGAEEQLSVGSSAYVRAHRREAAHTGLVINFDSVASPLGHWIMSVAGGDALARHATRALAAHGLDVATRPEITPFSDHFPFNRVGVPSLWFMRTNFPGGRWQHHSVHDTLENVSAEEVRRLLFAVEPLVRALAARRQWPFPTTLPAPQAALARKLGRELFG